MAEVHSIAAPAPATATEQWRDVVGFEGLYMVSDHGNVRSLDKIARNGKRKRGRIRALTIGSTGYYTVGLYVAERAKVKMARVHRLVAEAFLGKPPGGKRVVNHIDGDKLNNHVSNLEWATIGENNSHPYRVLKKTHWISGKTGAGHPASKPVALVCSCCGHETRHESVRAAAKHLGCAQALVGAVLAGEYQFAKGHSARAIGWEPNQRPPRRRPKATETTAEGWNNQHPHEPSPL